MIVCYNFTHEVELAAFGHKYHQRPHPKFHVERLANYLEVTVFYEDPQIYFGKKGDVSHKIAQ